MPGQLRLTKTSKAVLLLRNKFEKGDITGDEQPKVVWESESIFQKYKLSNFRTCYNAMRLEFSGKSSGGTFYNYVLLFYFDQRCTISDVLYDVLLSSFGNITDAECEDTEDGRLLDRRCITVEPTSSGRKLRFAASSGNEMGESDVEELEDCPGSELVTGDLTFKPLYIISKWTERTTLAKKISIAIILPSGVDTGDSTISVVDGGQYLQLTVVWPKPVVDVLVLHRWKLAVEAAGLCHIIHRCLGLRRL